MTEGIINPERPADDIFLRHLSPVTSIQAVSRVISESKEALIVYFEGFARKQNIPSESAVCIEVTAVFSRTLCVEIKCLGARDGFPVAVQNRLLDLHRVPRKPDETFDIIL